MDILFIGKRFYTNRDAYIEKYGRIYKLPYYWSQEKSCQLWLIDYYSKEKITDYEEKLKITSTPIFSLSFLTCIFKNLIKRPKIVIASGDCYIGLLGFLLAKLTFSKFFFDVYDKYDTFTGYRNLLGINIYKFLLNKSDMCFFASQKLLNDSRTQCKKTFFLPNGIDKNHFYPRDKNKSRKEFNLSEKDLYIGYFGSMELDRGIDDLIEAVNIIRENGIDLKILLAGKKRENLNLDYNFIHYLGNISFNKIPFAIASCDLLALPYRNSDMMDNGASCKIAEYISMEIPIVTTMNPNIQSNFCLKNINDSFLFSQCNNPRNLATCIEFQLKNKIKLNIKLNHEWKVISNSFSLNI
ncbi:glycosyltransferase [Acinetobacter sp. NBRC 110496]|uniref:glycosyltransferase n=1 Tax=Acinetobacter sp. NBRC 110496 TaxID=1550715 RepID=UPI0005C6820A|nr:glycosyltransferase [Acinetobacter sp. NBRC 110496]